MKFYYEQVIDGIIDLIRMKKYVPGDRLPSERVLAEQFNCNYHTVRKSMRILSKDNVVEQIPRLGTFVKRDARYLVGQTQSKVKIVSSRKIGVVVPPEVSEYLSVLLVELHCAAVSKNAQLEIRPIQGINETTELSEELKKNGCNCLILLATGAYPEIDFAEFSRKSVLPVVSGRHIVSDEEDGVHDQSKTPDGYISRSMQLLCRYFSALDRKHIAFIGGSGKVSPKFLEYNSQMNAEGRPSLCGFVNSTSKSLDDLVSPWEKYKGSLAVICEDDIYAMRLVNSLWKHGWTLPKDGAVAGFNNTSIATVTDPKLTTIQFPFVHLAKDMLRQSIALIEGDVNGKEKSPPPNLIIRESCGGSMMGEKTIGEIIKTLKGDISYEVTIDMLKEESGQQISSRLKTQ